MASEFNSWAFVWTFLGFILILAGTSIDSWTSTIQTVNVIPNSNATILPLGSTDRHTPLTRRGEDNDYDYDYALTGEFTLEQLNAVRFTAARTFGSLAGSYDFIYGYDYDEICPGAANKHVGEDHHPNHAQEMGHRTRQLNRVGAGMIALLLLTNTVCFVASFQTFLAVTGSSIGGNLASAQRWAIGGFISTVVTWALWLRAYHNYLNQKSHCRFEGFERLDVVLGGSFGLFVAATFFYLILFVNLSRYLKSDPTAMSGRWLAVVAVAGFTAVFVGSIYNSWSRAGSPTTEQDWEQQINDLVGGSHVHVDFNQDFGVYTAFQTVSLSFAYHDGENRDFLCKWDLNHDGSSEALVQGGQVTLGFAITATVLSFFAAWLQLNNIRFGFWLSVAAVKCVAVSLIVWSTTAHFILSNRCCERNTCVLSDSFGLIASGAGLLVAAIFYQAWVMKDEVFVLPAHAYGMANQFETELQTVQ